jgi:hypothetical protein
MYDYSMREKKAYQAPRLEKLGTLAELTMSLGKQGTADGGTPPNVKS